MKKKIKYAFIVAMTLTVHGAIAQQLVARDSAYSTATFLYLKAGNFSAKLPDYILVESDIFPYRGKTPIRKLTLANGKYDGTISGGQIIQPGLSGITWMHTDSGVLHKYDTSFFYVPSMRQVQSHATHNNSYLKKGDLAGDAVCREIRDSLRKWGDAMQLVFSRLSDQPSKPVPGTTDTIRYSKAAFYEPFNKLAADLSAGNDSGKILEASFSISLTSGITLINWTTDPKLHSVSTDLVKVYAYRDQIIHTMLLVLTSTGLIGDREIQRKRIRDWLGLPVDANMRDSCYRTSYIDSLVGNIQSELAIEANATLFRNDLQKWRSARADVPAGMECYKTMIDSVDNALFKTVSSPDSTSMARQLHSWMTIDSNGTQLGDNLLFFKRPDNYITDDFLRKYASSYKSGAPAIWIGFAEKNFRQFIISFRLVGPVRTGTAPAHQ